MGGLNKTTADLLFNLAIFGGGAAAIWYGYTNNIGGIKTMIEGAGAKLTQAQTGVLPTPPIQQYPSISQTGSIPNLSGFETGYSPGGGPIPGGAPGISYGSAIYESPFGTPSIDPRTGIDYSLYYPPTGTGTLPGTNPSPYPNPCLPGYYRASDLKCYPIPTQFPGSGCGEGMYLANDGRCYPYPAGTGGGYGAGGTYGAGGGYSPTPCPLGEYRASDGRCYALPTPPPEACPTGAYRASDGKCYPLTPGGSVGNCPAGYYMASDGVCRATTQCPAGYTMRNGVCTRDALQCPTGYTEINGVCVQNPQTSCPTGYTYHNGMCVYSGPTQCPSGYTLQGGMCVQQQPQCPPGYTLQGNMCVPNISQQCPPGYQLTAQGCVPIVSQQCPPGYELGPTGCTPVMSQQCPPGYQFNPSVGCIYIGQQNTIPQGCPAGYQMYPDGSCRPAFQGSPLSISLSSRTLIKELPPGVSPSQFSESVLKVEPYKVDVTMWKAVMMNPQYTGGVPVFAVIIKTTDESETNDAVTRANFRPLTSDDLMRYVDPGGSYYASSFAGFNNGKKQRRFNKRILRQYR